MNAVPEKIKTAFNEYRRVVERVKERQDHWNATTKDEVFRVLNSISEELPLRTVEGGSIRNFDTVCLAVPRTPSNIVLREGENGARGLTKNGAYLFYSQVFNGMILVGVSYSHVEELQEAKPNKGIAMLDPAEITEVLILEHVEVFFHEITQAEQAVSMKDQLENRGQFGFPIPDFDESSD